MAPSRRRGWAALGTGITTEIREAVHRQFALLSGDCQDVLVVAAVAGPAFDLEVIRSVCGKPADQVRALVEDEVSAGVLDVVSSERGVFRFVAPGFREVLVEELPAERHRWLAQKIHEVRRARA